MKDYRGYLICSDLDGTFIDNCSNLIEKNLDALDDYMKNGGLFTVSTGRAAHYLKENYGDRLKINTYLICLNGTMIYDTETDKIIYSRYMDKSALSDINDYFENIEGAYFHTENMPYTNFFQIPENEELHKVVFVSRTVEECFDLRKRLEERYGDICDFNRSWATGLEMLPKGAGKGDCVKKLREILGNKVKTVIAVGDFENDLTMIKEADIGVAVENAADFVKAEADKITVSNEDGAIAKIIEELKG